MLAHLIGDGSFVRRQPIRYASIDEANLVAVTSAAQHFGVTAVRDEFASSPVTHIYLPCAVPGSPTASATRSRPGCDELGLFGLRSHEKFMPAAVFSLPQASRSALFLRHLWATDGSRDASRTARSARSTTRRPAGGWPTTLRGCCSGSAIVAPLKTVEKAGYRDGYHVVRLRRREPAAIPRRDRRARRSWRVGAGVARSLAERRANTNVDTVPVEVWADVRERSGASDDDTSRSFPAAMAIAVLRQHALRSTRRAATGLAGSPSCSTTPTLSAMRDQRRVLGQGRVDRAARRAAGLRRDCRSARTTSLPMASSSHNSLEQDADMVILLHREDALREGVSPRRRGRLHRGQAPQRPDRHGHRRVPGPLLPLRRHEPDDLVAEDALPRKFADSVENFGKSGPP